ncbi:hypothetical protein DCC85_09375 [Paenibacillus sp. CAA11]|uniref:protein phosphatase 2C domain-containing protein n=1 Tax=Paenibacillus sp. CAA11 TaxID=1532905 RepID=UPI000D37A61B|nr:protein phosphatase 2C domain-containing protein [Paenibacillus sp. CAA11]AWB44417.1 hypothetical protein DCC85_09375 [Paenibacillus sp. CAA11]
MAPAFRRNRQMQQGKFMWTCEQLQVQPLTIYRRNEITCKYAYSPSADSLFVGDAGQDYAAICVDKEDIVFVLCDGVSLSYRGDFGARFLGERLLSWLCEEPAPSAEGLRCQLAEIADAASQAIKELHIPTHLPQLLREVLEEKRSMGTEAMYICGRVRLPRPSAPGKLWLGWQGDARVRMWEHEGEIRLAELTSFCTADRWSSREKSPQDDPYIAELPLSANDPKSLLIYSDGFKALDSLNLPPMDQEVYAVLDAEMDRGLEDDASLLLLSWGRGMRPIVQEGAANTVK